MDAIMTGNTTEVLGYATSHTPEHNLRSHPDTPTLVKGEKGYGCSACRWFECEIVYDPQSRTYTANTVGRSVVPGETDRNRVYTSTSAFKLVEMLTVFPREGKPFLPRPSALALAEGASVDEDLCEAYVNRAVL
jgi:hypothetical protein